MTRARTSPAGKLPSVAAETRVAFDRAGNSIEILLVAAPLLAILFNRWLGPLTPIVVFLVVPLFCLLRWERLYSVFARCWPLVLLPGLCLLSTLWSQAPGQTLRYAVLYLLTVIPALMIGAGIERSNALKGLFVAFAPYSVCSVLFGRYVGWDGPGGQAFAGLAGSKNASADTAALSLLVASTIILWSLSQRRFGWLLAAVIAIPFASFCLIAAKATGSLIATGVALPCLFAWAISRRLHIGARSAIFVIAIGAVILLVATFDYWMPPLFDAILENSGKDAGLTGRSLIWQKADELIAVHPLLGTGYNGFWVRGNLDAEYIWRAMGIASREGFNFHNTPRDILIDLGYVGLAAFGILSIYCSIRLLITVMLNPDYFGIFCCCLLVLILPRIFFELIGFQNMHYSTILVFTAFAYALSTKTLTRLRGI